MLTRVTLAAFLALYAAFAWPQADPALLAKLRQGGYVLYLRHAFGRAERTNEARGGPANTNDPTRYDPLRQLMATKPPAGQNAVISSHGNPFYAVFGPPYLAEGDMAVVQPSGFAVVGRIRLSDWQAFD